MFRRSVCLPFFVLICLFLLSGCGGKAQWYKEGHTQADFDMDVQECEIIASEFARQASLTGEREDPATLIRAVNSCLYAKGWSNFPTQKNGQDAEEPARLAVYDQGVLTGFKKTINIPPGFVLLSDSTGHSGPTTSQTLFFTRDNTTYINILFQKTLNDVFEKVEYPVVEPFFLYHRGEKMKRPDIDWAIFTGEFQKEWVVGFGAFLRANRKERITIVVTHPLPAQDSSPPSELRLTRNQYQAADLFTEEWSTWARENIN